MVRHLAPPASCHPRLYSFQLAFSHGGSMAARRRTFQGESARNRPPPPSTLVAWGKCSTDFSLRPLAVSTVSPDTKNRSSTHFVGKSVEIVGYSGLGARLLVGVGLASPLRVATGGAASCGSKRGSAARQHPRESDGAGVPGAVKTSGCRGRNRQRCPELAANRASRMRRAPRATHNSVLLEEAQK